MISPLKQFFEKWLDLMEEAFAELSYKQYGELEDKIRKEIGACKKKKLQTVAYTLHPEIKKRKHRSSVHISACAFILTNPMLSGVTFLF